MTDIGNKINELMNKKDTKKIKTNLTQKYNKLFNDYKSIIQVKNPKVYDLIMTGIWNEYQLDWIQRVLKETYDANASDELKQKDNENRLKYNSSKTNCISRWKKQGIRSADWNSTYELYINCKNCELNSFFLKFPNNALVTILDPSFFTPLISTQVCVPSKTTPSPSGFKALLIELAISLVNLS